MIYRLVYVFIKVLLLLTILIAGCAPLPGSPPPPAPEPPGPAERPKGSVSYHVWGVLISFGAEQREHPGYSVYTYVLFNSNQQNVGSSDGRRYDAILQALLQDVKSERVGIEAGWPKSDTNIFCIPSVTRYLKKDDALAKYDFELSQQYLAGLQGSVRNNRELFNRLERRPGPFLVSLCEPLPRLQGKIATKMLYLDLSDMPADGMRQVLDAYKQRLDAEPIKNVERLRESLKIVLMKYVLLLDENLKIVDVAFARFK